MASKGKVLVLDDSQPILDVIRDRLEKSGYDGAQLPPTTTTTSPDRAEGVRIRPRPPSRDRRLPYAGNHRHRGHAHAPAGLSGGA